MGSSRSPKVKVKRSTPRRSRPSTRPSAEGGVEMALVPVSKSFKTGDTFSTEIWALIFEELGQITDNSSFSSYRLVSQRFDSIVQTFVFRRFEASKIFLAGSDQKTTVSIRIAVLVKAHTKRLVFGGDDLDWDKAAEFINECRSVQDLEWNHGHSDYSIPFPPEIRKVLEVDKPHLRLHLSGFFRWNAMPRKYVRSLTGPLNLSTVPRINLISFTSYCQYWTSHQCLLQELLVAAKLLQSLDIKSKAFDVKFGRLPPIKTLSLRGPWPYKAEDVEKIWDFSKLESLKLRSGCAPGFLERVPGQLVEHIQTLQIEDLIISRVPLQSGAIPMMTDYFLNFKAFIEKIKGLVDVSVRFRDIRHFIPVLAEHSKTLNILKLDDMNTRIPTLNFDSLTELRLKLPNLVELQVDLEFPTLQGDRGADRNTDQKGWYIREYRLGIVSSFTKLRKLTIRPQKLPQEYGTKYRKLFCDDVVRELTSHKKGRSFSEITIHWRRRKGIVYDIRPEYLEMIYSWGFDGEMKSQVILGPMAEML